MHCLSLSPLDTFPSIHPSISCITVPASSASSPFNVCSNWYMLGELMLRCWDALQHFPFRLAKLDKKFPEKVRSSVNDEVSQACPRCMDNLTAMYKKQGFGVTNPPGLLDGEVGDSIHDVFSHLSICNVQTKDLCNVFCLICS